jgi:hypothetical protein
VTSAPTALHVTNGDSVVDTLGRTSLGGDALPWRDVLTEGPVPAVENAELRDVRARFLSAYGWGDARALRAELEARDEQLAAALVSRRPIVFWFEHDLYDQLQLLQVLSLVAAADCDLAHVELINVDSFLGTLDPPELEALWPLRAAVTPAQLELAGEAWAAFRAPEPPAVAALLARDTSALPFLGAALARLLEELPDTRTGLARSERQLLEALEHGPRTAMQLFTTSQEREEARFDGDTWVFARLARLEGLLEAAGGAALPPVPPGGDERLFMETMVDLTDDGARVLAGEADRVALLGIDRWLGGTRLTPDRLWRWDASSGCPVSGPRR